MYYFSLSNFFINIEISLRVTKKIYVDYEKYTITIITQFHCSPENPHTALSSWNSAWSRSPTQQIMVSEA